MIEPIQYLHNNGLLHSDIKPGNILFKLNESNTIEYKLTDYNIIQYANVFKDSNYYAFGTEYYIQKNEKKNFNVDTYMLGATLLNLLIIKCEMKPVYKYMNIEELYKYEERIEGCFIGLNGDNKILVKNAITIIKLLLNKDRNKRLYLNGIKHILNNTKYKTEIINVETLKSKTKYYKKYIFEKSYQYNINNQNYLHYKNKDILIETLNNTIDTKHIFVDGYDTKYKMSRDEIYNDYVKNYVEYTPEYKFALDIMYHFNLDNIYCDFIADIIMNYPDTDDPEIFLNKSDIDKKLCLDSIRKLLNSKKFKINLYYYSCKKSQLDMLLKK
jgi:serine/threonine protein kinase